MRLEFAIPDEIPIVLDDMDNTFARDYAPWPFRYYIIRNGVIELKPQPIGGTYDLVPIWNYIE
jgi:hypothetical protein